LSIDNEKGIFLPVKGVEWSSQTQTFVETVSNHSSRYCFRTGWLLPPRLCVCKPQRNFVQPLACLLETHHVGRTKVIFPLVAVKSG
jgi:hypothetical protein